MTMMCKGLVAMVAIGLALPAQAAHAQQAAQPSPAPAYVLPFTHMWDMTSDAGETYRILVSFPGVGDPPAEGYPVLYVLDGNASFATFAEARRLQEYEDIGKSIVVGVGYPTDMPYHARRTGDFVEPSAAAGTASDGRKAFLDFLTGKLRSEIARRYRTDPERQSLFGHSFGGLLALHALYARPQAFHSIVAASPSLEWDGQAILREERAFVDRLTAGKVGKTSRLMIVVGGRDVDDDPEPARALADRFDRFSGHGLRTRFRRYEEEGHMTVPARAVTDTLRFVFE